MQSEPIILLEQLTAGVQITRLIHDIDWQILAGQHWIITGEMGTGKTTLARCLVSKVRVFSGNIQFPFLGEQAGFDARQQAIKMVSFSDTSKLFHSVNNDHYYQQRYQAFDSEGHLTVRQYLEHSGFDEKKPQHWSVIQHTGLEPLLDLERIKLSSGQTRKMLIAKAIISAPKILILDNPYLGLDAPSRQAFNDYIDELANKSNMTIILSGHYEELPNCISHRIHLEGGKVKAKGRIDRVNNQVSDHAIPKIKSAVSNLLKNLFLNTQTSDLQNIIKLEEINMAYGKKIIFEHLSWQVRPGEKWALLGNNGSGKSTILSLIYADNPQAYAKSITLFDRRRGSGESIWDIKKKIGFTSSELHAYFEYHMKARDVVLTGLWDGFILQRRPTPEQLELSEQLFQFFGMEKYLLQPFHKLSTGQQRLLFFMRALIKAPELLLLDEPFQGLDAPTIEKCRWLLDEVLDDKHALVFITHYQSEIPSCVDQVLNL